MLKIINICVFSSLMSLSAIASSATTTDPQCNDTIDTLAEPYQLQYRPSLSSNGCGIGSLSNFNLFNGGLFGADFFKNALCSAVRSKIQPYVDQVNSGVSTVNGITSTNQISSGMNGVMSGNSPSVIINDYTAGTTSNINQLFH